MYLYPTFYLSQENFEKALPVALHLSKEFNLPCHYWPESDSIALAFKDEAVNRCFYYTHKHEKEILLSLEKHLHFRFNYTNESVFENSNELI